MKGMAEEGRACASCVQLPQWHLLPDIGLYMDQVITLMERTFLPACGAGEITKSMVNNYVKSGLIKRPVGKKYDREQLAQLVMIGVLKQALSMEDIAKLLSLLCTGGTQAGYVHFCGAAEAIGAALDAGNAQAPEIEHVHTPQERAVLAGISAAVCAMHARSVLASLDRAENI